MAMEVMIKSPQSEFNFESACTTPYMSAPSSPPRAFYSAPASPSRVYVPFDWEEKPGIPKTRNVITTTATSSNYGDDNHEDILNDADFAFDFSGHLETNPTLPADELFHGGKIRPLKPPPRLNFPNESPKSPKSPKSPTKFIKEAFSPRNRSKSDFDPFESALEQTRNENTHDEIKRGRDKKKPQRRRSLSPFRVSDLLFDPDPVQPDPVKTSSFWYKKWKIKDLLLFRSASESRATDKNHPVKKYVLLKKTGQDDHVKNSSFRSVESVGSVSGRVKPGPPISAHELHYTVNRAVSEEMKKRTPLPYKQGLLGCLGFHPAGPEITMGFSSTGSFSRG